MGEFVEMCRLRNYLSGSFLAQQVLSHSGGGEELGTRFIFCSTRIQEMMMIKSTNYIDTTVLVRKAAAGKGDYEARLCL